MISDEEGRAALRKEFEWLVDEELPVVFMQLGRLLKETTKAFTLESNGGTTRENVYVKKGPKPVTRIAAQDGTIDGTVEMVGLKLVSAGLMFKIPKTSKTPQLNCKAEIPVTSPLIVKQAQAILNFMKLTLLEIEETLHHQQLKSSSPDQLLHVVGRLIGMLIKAKNNMVMADRRMPEECMAEHQLLSPIPPKNLVTGVHIENAELVMTAFVVAEFGGIPTQEQLEAIKRMNSRNGVGHVFRYGGMWWEVVLVREARGAHEGLKSCFVNLELMLELAQRTQDKLRVFRDFYPNN
eukprot:m.331073 g.331073  ORF g.331073 m.331073 type:complete len:294 (-) comp16635_c0_seq1:417-1298(-)